MVEKKWFGNYRVVRTGTASRRAFELLRTPRDRGILKRHVLKLAYWPTGAGDDPRSEADLDWDWIRGCEQLRIGEQRIDETIGGMNNLRVIFFKANTCLPDEDQMRIWILTVFQKKSQGFGDPLIRAWTAARKLIVKRYYEGSTQA